MTAHSSQEQRLADAERAALKRAARAARERAIRRLVQDGLAISQVARQLRVEPREVRRVLAETGLRAQRYDALPLGTPC